MSMLTGVPSNIERLKTMYYFRVTYQTPLATEIQKEEFLEFAAETTVIESILKRQHPEWIILMIERGLKS